MRFNRRVFLTTASLVAVEALLAACGGGAATTAPSTAPSSAPSSAPSIAPTAAATRAATTATGASAASASASSVATTAATATRAAATPAIGAATATRAASSVAASPTARLNTNVTLTFYNAQHESLVKAMTEAFTKETGVKVAIRSGKDFDLANQIVQEGAGSPADAFITENSPAMQVVANKGLFLPVDKATLAQVPARYSPSTGDWMGVAARSTVLIYNPQQLQASALPKSITELSGAAWQGKLGIAAAGADFQAIVSAVLALTGADATSAWLKGLKTNAKIYSGNGAVMRAVNAGEIPAGIVYHYYWFEDRADSGANSKNTELYFFPNRDPGAFLSVSGIGALKSSKNPVEAQALLQFMTGKGGQQALASSMALEYTLNPEVPANPKLKPFSELDPPEVDIAKLNGAQVVDLMQQAGLL
jgi:iron(III) transport system substrate-binding protein